MVKKRHQAVYHGPKIRGGEILTGSIDIAPVGVQKDEHHGKEDDRMDIDGAPKSQESEKVKQ